MTDAYIYDAVRTPRGRGKKDGSLHQITALELGTQVLENLRERSQLDSKNIDDVIFGCVSPVGEQGTDIARMSVLNAEYDDSVAGVQVNRFCASGLEAVNMAAAKVMSGEADLAIGGGVESMSRVPMGSDGGPMAADPEFGLKTYFVPQGISADLIATKYGFSRNDVDSYAAESQNRAAAAWEEARFSKTITPVHDRNGLEVLGRDEHMRPGTTVESLEALRPAFADMGEQYGFDSVAIQRYPEVASINHVHHAGNSSGIVDGAAGVLVGNEEIGHQLGMKPRARIRAMASIGSEPCIMLTGPEKVTAKVLGRAGMATSDIDIWELNEAFAAVVLRYMQALDIDHQKINVNGGAIAMGHPLGATGAMLLGTVLDELERTGQSTALTTLCVGAGMGTATIIERV